MKKIFVALVVLGAVGCRRFNSEGQLERYSGGRAFWSFLVPGIGQVQNGEGGKATMLISLELLNLATYFQKEGEEKNDERLYSVMGVLRLWSVSDAYCTAQSLNKTDPFEIKFMPRGTSLDRTPEVDSPPLVFVLDPIGRRASAMFQHRF